MSASSGSDAEQQQRKEEALVVVAEKKTDLGFRKRLSCFLRVLAVVNVVVMLFVLGGWESESVEIHFVSTTAVTRKTPLRNNSGKNGENGTMTRVGSSVFASSREGTANHTASSLEDSQNHHNLTVVLMYFAEPAGLLRQLEQFSSYPSDVRQQFALLVVDDGSPAPNLTAQSYVTQKHRQALTIEIAYIQKNIPWNTPGARNLAFKVASTDKVLMIDTDLFITLEVMEKALKWKTRTENPPGGYIGHTFNRKKPSGQYQAHPSAMLMDVGGFWKAGGMEEDFSGN